MKLNKYLYFLFKDESISKEYILNISEKEFISKSKEKIASSDYLNPLYLGTNKFIGSITGYKNIEFSLKIKASFFHKNSLGDIIWLKGTINEIEPKKIKINAFYKRTKFLKTLNLTIIINTSLKTDIKI